MALQDTGQITATDIMAEFSYPASTKWAVSTDGAGFINFAVGSIIKYSDFYSASASTGSAFTFPLAVTNDNSQVIDDGFSGTFVQSNGVTGLLNTVSSAAVGFIVQPTDTFTKPTAISANGSNVGLGVNLSTGGDFKPSKFALGWVGYNGPPDNGFRGVFLTYTMPFTAESGKTYELWSNYTGAAGYHRGNSTPNFTGGDQTLIKLAAGSYGRYWGYARNFTRQNQIGDNQGENVATTSGNGQVYGIDDYIARGNTGFGDPRDGFVSLKGNGMIQTNGPLFRNIPGAQIIAQGNSLQFSVVLACPVQFSTQQCAVVFGGGSAGHFGSFPSSVADTSITNSQDVQPPGGVNKNVGFFEKMGGYTGAADPNNVDGTYGNISGLSTAFGVPPGERDRPVFEVVETGTY